MVDHWRTEGNRSIASKVDLNKSLNRGTSGNGNGSISGSDPGIAVTSGAIGSNRSSSSSSSSSQPYHNLLHMSNGSGTIGTTNPQQRQLRLDQLQQFQQRQRRQQQQQQEQQQQQQQQHQKYQSVLSQLARKPVELQRQSLSSGSQTQQSQSGIQTNGHGLSSSQNHNQSLSQSRSQSLSQSRSQSLGQSRSQSISQGHNQSHSQGSTISSIPSSYNFPLRGLSGGLDKQVQPGQTFSQTLAHSQARRLNMPASVANPLAAYKARKDQERVRVLAKYDIVGYIAAGTYGRVYKANSKNLKENRVCAIKKFKADKEGEVTHYTGISQSACREMALCRELNHKNITKLVEIILEDKSIYMVFDFAEHDLLQIIHFHCHPERRAIPESTVKSVLWQLLNGVSYLHQNWVLHRDLKPANIMLTSDGVVKIGDLGLARLFKEPLQSLWAGDKVVVTIWYRAPELLFGARHYTPAIDLWAVGCVFAELLSLRPIFKGEEAKMDNKRNVPFQRNQVQKVVEILGTPTVEKWPALSKYPEYHSLQSMKPYSPNLESWYHSTGWTNAKGFELLSDLLEYDPAKRITANDALLHPYFTEAPRVSQNVFEGQNFEYPCRRISSEDNDIKASSFPGTKRTAIDDSTQVRKKQK
ncbi:cyclin-dependent serine/threonine protein kinase SSN3 [Sugiyamaella lignohabitans]|uniref:Cyclin-dependent kinase 8 n=1 Tax=Sugiyamaella lignohabitans TaxID=796027 RepID=A0A161HX00_9ASCO|nr:cyclin-dependent serine/threonine protein kinase SSN3 [Sugiyamaella lignohabitans]ANB14956.1 cyclin-dependent serine/threonine protein kinase SSN3 [Sugiyamaella lignohabitans]